jgi:hypothetical protein
VRARKDLALSGGGAFRDVTSLRLSEAAIDALVDAKLDELEHELLPRFPGLLRVPADAQLVVFSMGWAMGPGKFAKFPHFTSAINAEDFRVAASESHMIETGNPGIRLRNVADELLLRAAARVVDEDLPRDELHGPLGPYKLPPHGGAAGVAGALVLFLFVLGGAVAYATR